MDELTPREQHLATMNIDAYLALTGCRCEGNCICPDS